MKGQLSMFDVTEQKKSDKVVNVASVPQRSPFRYPGGKTWLIPVVRSWLKQDNSPKKLVEPFAGGGIVSLTAVFEKLTDSALMVELDHEVAAVWEVIINGNHNSLAERIFSFDLTVENANTVLQKKNKTIEEQAFSTILKNRIFHGGIITKGAGMIKNGENGKGIKSRWYPKTLRNRIIAIGYIKNKLEFQLTDAFEVLESRKTDLETFFFIDPPYKKAGKRLYTYFDIDHELLFAKTAEIKGRYMMTYDDTEEIRSLIDKYRLKFKTIPMKTTHHIQKNEIIISDNFNWW